MKIKAGIIGGAGYTGGELIRLLIHHPGVSVSFIHSKSSAGSPLHTVHQDLLGETELNFSDSFHDEIDLLFLCVGHGEAQKFLSENKIPDRIKIIDLSQDFRLNQKAETGNRKFIYGLPELNRDRIRSANSIANPGCFATCIQLGLLPLAKAGLLKKVYTTGITGSTGAGQSLTDTSHFSWRANNIQAYKTLTHQHIHEIRESLKQLQGDEVDLSFVPWRGDFTRGIFVSSQLTCTMATDKLVTLYKDYFKEHPFTFISEKTIFLKQVVNTNKCIIQLEKLDDKLVVHSITDNLLKG